MLVERGRGHRRLERASSATSRRRIPSRRCSPATPRRARTRSCSRTGPTRRSTSWWARSSGSIRRTAPWRVERTVAELGGGLLRPVVGADRGRAHRAALSRGWGYDAGSLAHFEDRMRESLAWLAELVGGRTFLLGRSLTIADVAVFAQLAWMRHYAEDATPRRRAGRRRMAAPADEIPAVSDASCAAAPELDPPAPACETTAAHGDIRQGLRASATSRPAPARRSRSRARSSRCSTSKARSTRSTTSARIVAARSARASSKDASSRAPGTRWQFDVRTGESVTDDSKVAVYECKVEGDQVIAAI